MLFGAAPGAAGRTLTERREKAASAAGYEAHHFRKRIEPQICDRLANALAADAAEVGVRAAAPRLTQPRRPLRLPTDVFAWEAAEHEEALSTLWADVYALRAALLAVARLASMSGADHPDTWKATGLALYRTALAHRTVLTYKAAYGPQLLGADPGTPPEELVTLAGWQPNLDSELVVLLASAIEHQATDERWPAVPGTFADAVDRWRHELASASIVPTKEQEPWT